MAKERHLTFVERLIEQALGNNQKVGADDDPAETEFPTLYEWLSTVYVGKDKIKVPASLSINLAPGGVIVRVTDRDLSRSVEVTCQYLNQALSTMEQALTGERVGMKIIGKKEPKLRTRQKL